MAKKFHGSKADGRVGQGFYRSSGSDMSKHEEYANVDERRKMENQDFHMIKEDQTAIANLPQQVIMKEWPRTPYGKQSPLDDTIKGVQRQQEDDAGEMKKYDMPEKY